MEVILLLGLCIGGLWWFIIFAQKISNTNQKNANENRIKNYEAAYKKALADLRSESSSTELREKAIRAAREYSEITQKTPNTQLIDEDTLMKEINSLQSNMESTEKSNLQKVDNLESELRKIKKMLDDGLITDEEYQELRKKVMKSG